LDFGGQLEGAGHLGNPAGVSEGADFDFPQARAGQFMQTVDFHRQGDRPGLVLEAVPEQDFDDGGFRGQFQSSSHFISLTVYYHVPCWLASNSHLPGVWASMGASFHRRFSSSPKLLLFHPGDYWRSPTFILQLPKLKIYYH